MNAQPANPTSLQSRSSSASSPCRSAITCLAARADAQTADHFYTAGGERDGPAERPGAGRRLRERGELSRHCRPGGASGFDGLIYSIGWLVGWPIVMFLIAEPLRNLGRYTFADVVAAAPAADAGPRRRRRSARSAVIAFYLIAQMVGAGNLIRLLFGLPATSRRW